MEVRVHKLLILVGEEGSTFQSRDFNKIIQVFQDEYLSQKLQQFSNHIAEILPKVISLVPQKQHIYAGLTAKISVNHSQLANKIIQKSFTNLQLSLNAGKLYEAINILTYFSQLMNISLFNSLSFMNILQDIMEYLQAQINQKYKRFYADILVRTLPIYIFSMNEKVFHDLKKLIEKLQKYFPNNMLLSYMVKLHAKGKLIDGSLICRLDCKFQDIIQNSPKFRLKLTSLQESNQKWHPIEYFQNIDEEQDELFKQFYREEGQIHKYVLQQLIEQFYSNGEILDRKLTNYIKSITSHKEAYLYKTIILVLIAKCLKSSRPLVQKHLLILLTNISQQNQKITQVDIGKMIQSKLQQIFCKGENLDFNTLVSFSNLCSFIYNNWKFQWEWERFVQNQDKFSRRQILLKITLEKIRFLNDKFVLPKSFEPFSQFETPAKLTNQHEYLNIAEMEKLEKIQADLKSKLSAQAMIQNINSQSDYQIFLQALFRRTSISQTHLQILMKRYEQVFKVYQDFDWTLINKIRNFWKFSYFNRHLYLQCVLKNNITTFNSYVSYIGELKDKNEKDMIWIKVELNQLNNQFGVKNSKKTN